jgi:hypothetical protein
MEDYISKKYLFITHYLQQYKMENMRTTLYNIWTSKIYKSFDIVYIREREICVVRFTSKRFHIACNIGMRNIYHFFEHIDTHTHT